MKLHERMEMELRLKEERPRIEENQEGNIFENRNFTLTLGWSSTMFAYEWLFLKQFSA